MHAPHSTGSMLARLATTWKWLLCMCGVAWVCDKSNTCRSYSHSCVLYTLCVCFVCVCAYLRVQFDLTKKNSLYRYLTSTILFGIYLYKRLGINVLKTLEQWLTCGGALHLDDAFRFASDFARIEGSHPDRHLNGRHADVTTPLACSTARLRWMWECVNVCVCGCTRVRVFTRLAQVAELCVAVGEQIVDYLMLTCS